MGVQARQVHVLGGGDAARGLVGVAVGQREPELLVLVGGGDVLVGVGLDADVDADHHVRAGAGRGGDLADALDLGVGVGDDASDAQFDRLAQLGGGLVVPVVAEAGRVDPGGERDGQLPAGAHVDVQALLDGRAEHGLGAERLRGVEDVGAGEGPGPGAAAGPEVVLVEDVGGGAEPLGELADGDAADVQGALAGAFDVRGPQLREQRVHVVGDAQPGGAEGGEVAVQHACFVGSHHMRSGAETPSRPSALARTMRVASASHRRATLTGAGSSPTRGTTRQSLFWNRCQAAASSSA